MPVPLSALRALALHTQALDRPPDTPPDAAMVPLVERLGCVQIDTLHMVARSHYLVLWSRLGTYDPAAFDALLFQPGQRQLFEFWRKAASIIPLQYYRYSLPRMRAFRDDPGKGYRRWLQDADNRATLDHVRERLRTDGGQRTSDFDYDGPKRGSWWDWKPAKEALEYLFAAGEVMIANRINFQRVYDLRERVLPEWVDTTEPTADEATRFHIAQAVRALGVCAPGQAASYAYMGVTQVRPHVKALIEDGTLIEIEGEIMGGETHTLVLHRDVQPLLQQALDGAIKPQRTTFLSFFDSLFWARGRDEAFWNFRNVLEAYKKEKDRIWGYYSMPILHHDRLVGRFDPRLDRKTGTLHLRALHLEPGIAADDRLVADVAGAMRDFLAFHHANDLTIADVGHADFRRKLLAVL